MDKNLLRLPPYYLTVGTDISKIDYVASLYLVDVFVSRCFWTLFSNASFSLPYGIGLPDSTSFMGRFLGVSLFMFLVNVSV